MGKKSIHTMITAFRDGFQSVYGARVLTDDFLPALGAAAKSGLTHFEVGGGARFQSLYFYCNEDAFTSMDRCREVVGPQINLQTLSRGINVVGLDSQPRDIIALHAQLFKKHGMTTIRNFDALNDVDNLIFSGQCIKDAGLNHEICVTVMELPPGCTGAHDEKFYTSTLRKILDSGVPFDSLCYKDASGTLTPTKVYDSLKSARRLLGDKIKLVYHTHETAGIGALAYKAALDAGVDQIDLSLAPASGGTGQTDVITMWHALRGSEYDLGLDILKIIEAENIFKECMKDYFVPPEAIQVEPMIPFYPMPGGALTANTQMLRDNGLMNRYPEMISAMGEAVKRGGFGTSVTPVSQFYFQQAFNNVMFGPWKKIAEGYGKMVLGYFGKTPTPPDKELVTLCSQQLNLPPFQGSILDRDDKDPTKGIPVARELLKKSALEDTQENIFIAATCKEKGIAFLKGTGTLGVRKNEKPLQKPLPTTDLPDCYNLSVDGKNHKIEIQGAQVRVDGKVIHYELTPVCLDPEDIAIQKSKKRIINLAAPLPGVILRIPVEPGDHREKGEDIIVLESMKMETFVVTPESCKVVKIHVKQGQLVQSGQILAELEV